MLIYTKETIFRRPFAITDEMETQATYGVGCLSPPVYGFLNLK